LNSSAQIFSSIAQSELFLEGQLKQLTVKITMSWTRTSKGGYFVDHPKEKGKVYCTHLDDNGQQCSKYTYDGPMTTHQGNVARRLESDHKFFESDACARVAEASKEGMQNFVMKMRTRAPMSSEDQKAMMTNLAIAV
jgi:hypothetical protein